MFDNEEVKEVFKKVGEALEKEGYDPIYNARVADPGQENYESTDSISEPMADLEESLRDRTQVEILVGDARIRYNEDEDALDLHSYRGVQEREEIERALSEYEIEVN